MDKEETNLEREINLLHERICYALGDPTRIMMLYLLGEKSACVNEIADALHLQQSTASRHLRVLRERKLVSTQRQGTSVQYTLTDKRIIQALDTLRTILSTQLEEDAEMVKSLHSKTPNYKEQP